MTLEYFHLFEDMFPLLPAFTQTGIAYSKGQRLRHDGLKHLFYCGS